MPEDSDSPGSKRKTATSPTTPSKCVKPSRNNGKKRGSQDVVSPTPPEEVTPTKKNKVFRNGDITFECEELNCGKKYKSKNGLSYHRRTMHTKSHSKKNEPFDDSGKVYRQTLFAICSILYSALNFICKIRNKSERNGTCLSITQPERTFLDDTCDFSCHTLSVKKCR